MGDVVGGLRGIEGKGYVDFFMEGGVGMKGYIVNVRIGGEGVVKNEGGEFVWGGGDILVLGGGEIDE